MKDKKQVVYRRKTTHTEMKKYITDELIYSYDSTRKTLDNKSRLTLLGPSLFQKYQDQGGAHCAPPHEIALIL